MKRLLLLTLLLSCSAWATIAPVAATPAGVVHTTAGTTCANAQTAGFGTASTHTIVVVVGMQPGAGPTVSVADNATGGTNTYTRLGTGVDTASGHVEVFYSVNIPRANTSGLVVTVTLPSQRHSCEVKAYTGVVSAAAAITSTNSGASASSGTITTATTSPNSWIIAGIAAGNGSTTVAALTGTLDNSAASTGSTTPSSGLVSNTSATQGANVTDAVTWGTARAWVAGAIELRSDLINPTISPNGGSFNNDTAASFTSADSGVTFCYTTDGTTTPAATSPGTCSTGSTGSSFTVIATATTLKVLATQTGWTNSAVTTSSAFTLTVGAVSTSPGAGTYSSAQTVTISIATTTGGSIRYTTDNATPSCPSTGTAYSTGFSVPSTEHVKAIGCKTNYVSSAVQDDLYTINLTTAACIHGLPLLGVGCGAGIAAAGGGTFTLAHRVADRAAWGDKLTCATTTCTLTVPSTTSGNIGILQFQGQGTGAVTTIASMNSCTVAWTHPTGANAYDSTDNFWADAYVCTNLNAGATTITVTFNITPDPSYTFVSYYEVNYSGASVTPIAATNTLAASGNLCAGPALSLGGLPSFVGQTVVNDFGTPGGSATTAASPYDTNFTNLSNSGNTLPDFALSYINNVTSTGAASWTVGTSAHCLGQGVALKGN